MVSRAIVKGESELSPSPTRSQLTPRRNPVKEVITNRITEMIKITFK